MESRTLISAVMPAYNAASTVEAAVRSVQAQTDQQWELIVVDDGSQDDTLARVQRLAAADPRISVHAAPHRGRGAARNLALERVRGGYIALCDADDLSRPQRFERQRAALDAAPDLFAVGAALAPFADEPNPRLAVLGTRRWPAGRDAVSRRFGQLRMAVPSAAVMLRATDLQQIGTFDEDLERAQDLDLFLRAHAAGLQSDNLHDVLVDYRQAGPRQSFAYYRANAQHHARVVRKHAHGWASLRPFALVHHLGPLAHVPRYGLYRLRRRIREGAI